MISLALGFGLQAWGQSVGQRRPRVDPELDRIIIEIRDDELVGRRGGRADLEAQIARLRQQNRRLVVSVRSMEERLADLEDLLFDHRRPGGGLGRAREFACVMRDSMHGRSFVGKSTVRIDAEMAAVGECQRAASNFNCQAKPICEEIDSLTSVVCVIRDSMHGRPYRGEGASQNLATHEALNSCIRGAGNFNCSSARPQCESIR